jgi:hypothetical protein
VEEEWEEWEGVERREWKKRVREWMKGVRAI